MAHIRIPKEYKAQDQLIAVPREEYRAFIVYQKEIADTLTKIKRGETEHRTGKTIKIKSLTELDS